jgi:hypothetical protein
MIDAEFSRKDHSSILATVIGRGPDPLDIRIDPKSNKTDCERQEKLN